jgi:hypothetical protein
MVAGSFKHGAEARAALRAIVSDPTHGSSALDSSQTVANLLQDLLPDAPRESGLLVAAVSAGMPALLRSYATQGMDAMTTISLASASFAERTAFMAEACQWVIAELAIALGLTDADGLALTSEPTQSAVRAGVAVRETAAAGTGPEDYPATVSAGLSPRTIARLDTDSPAAAGLLRLIASLAPDPVPVGVLLASSHVAVYLDPRVAVVLGPLLGDPAAQDEAIGVLRRLSLIAAAQAGTVVTHQLIQAVALGQMGAGSGRWRRAAATLVEAAIPEDTDPPEAWPVCALLLPHALAVLAGHSEAMTLIANYVGASGGYSAARDLQQDIVKARERKFGGDDPGTLTARANLAYWTGQAGNPRAARGMYAELVGDYEAILGPEHPETMTARGNLAEWTGHAGDPAAARDLSAELRLDHEATQGANHPDTLAARGEHASWAGEAGDAAIARDWYAELVHDCERVLGADDPDTLTACANLAGWTGHAGDPVAASDLYAELHLDYEAILGTSHPDTLDIRSDHAYWIGKAGDPAAARDMYARLLPDYEQVFGAEHPDTLTARRRLARWTGEAGDAAAARDQLAALLTAGEQLLGPRHPDTLAIRSDLAEWTGESGNPAAARAIYAALLPIRSQICGPAHPDTLTTRHDLAENTGQAGDPVTARDQLAGLLADIDRILGPEHPDSLTARTSLAYWTRRARSRPDTPA